MMVRNGAGDDERGGDSRGRRKDRRAGIAMNARFSTDAGRLEALSDGVIAVIITIMVLDLRPPSGTDLGSLHTILPTLAVYVMSFIFIGIYWNNHHHMLRATKGIDGRAMWANLQVLFWLSPVPCVTSWMGRRHLVRPRSSLEPAIVRRDDGERR